MPDTTPNNLKPIQTVSEAGPRIRPVSELIARKFGESAVLIHLQANSIYELNPTGARIWDLLVNGTARQDIVEMLRQEFDVEPASVSEAIDELLVALRAEGLIQQL